MSSNIFKVCLAASIIGAFTLLISSCKRIARFDLRAWSFLPEVLAPSKEVDGIKAFRNQLYFTDFHKWHVGVMPIADLRTANS